MSDELARAIQQADGVLPGEPVEEGSDPRWKAIIRVGELIEESPEEVWEFVSRWGCHPREDLRMAIATCLLEHLLEHHFETIFPRVTTLAIADSFFAETFLGCWKFGQSEESWNSSRFDELRARLGAASVP